MTDPDLIERVASEYHGAEWGYFTPEDHAYWRGTIATIIRLIDTDRGRRVGTLTPAQLADLDPHDRQAREAAEQ